MAATTRHTRRAGQTGQIDFQARSHFDAEDPNGECGTYRLVRCVGPSTWEVEWTAACCRADDASLGLPPTSTLRFISRDAYDRFF